jgi:SRP54-type protein, GTPase domain
VACDTFRSAALEQLKTHAQGLKCDIYGRAGQLERLAVPYPHQTHTSCFWLILRYDGGSNLCQPRVPSLLDPLRCLLLVDPAQWMLLDSIAVLLPMLSPAWQHQDTVSP